MVLAALPGYTPEQYLVLEETSEYKNEYVAGQIYAMTGASYNHNLLVRNICVALTNALGDGPCQPLMSDMRIQIKQKRIKKTAFTYPDVSVICGEPAFMEGRTDTITNPVVIFEVLSDSTRKYDSTTKFELYKNLQSLQQYILVEQDGVYIQSFQRLEGRMWGMESYQAMDENLKLPVLDLELSLNQLYMRLGFATPQAEDDETEDGD